MKNKLILIALVLLACSFTGAAFGIAGAVFAPQPRTAIVRVPSEPVIVRVPEVRVVEIPQACPVQAQPALHFMATRRPDVDVPDDLVHAFARVFVSEDNCVIWPEDKGSERHPDCGTAGELSDDARAIVQVARNVANMKGSTLLAAIQVLAKTPTGQRPPRKGHHRQAWVQGLPAAGDAQPPSWRECDHGSPPGSCDGVWALYADKWARLREATHEYLGNVDPDPPCPPSVLSWGTVADAERIAIPKRGHVKYDCGSRNWFGGPPRALAAL